MKSEVVTHSYEGKEITELVETFSTLGTQELKEGTGNPSYSKLAVVVAGKLLYVVDNSTQIDKGVMSIILSGYSKTEIDAMQDGVRNKR